MMSSIKIRTFTGGGIKPYIPSIAKLRMEMYRNYPFLYAGSLEQETQFLKKLSQCKDAIVVIVFDGSKIVGASTGLPCEDETPEIKKTLTDAGHDISQYFFFHEAILQKEYRGRGIGHHLFDHREAHVKHLKRFKHICFCSIMRPQDHPAKPKDFIPLDSFWKKRGYTHTPELKCLLPRQELGGKETTLKSLTFWIKNLN